MIMLSNLRYNFNNFFRNTRYMQYVSTSCVGLLEFTLATVQAWDSQALPLLTSSNSPVGVQLTLEESSWIPACAGLGNVPGGILISLLLDRIGSKFILLIGAICIFISWILLALTKSLAILLIARFVAGMGNGLTAYCVPIYICEIASNDNRGILGAIPVICSILGSILTFSVGPYVDYVTLIIISGTFPFLFIITFFFMPNSPYFLLKNDRCEDARANLTKLCIKSASSDEIEIELAKIQELIKINEKGRTLMQMFLAPNFLKPFLITFAAKAILDFSGFAALNNYSQIILEAGNINLSLELSSVIYGVVPIPAVIISGLLLDRLGRKPVFFLSSLGSSIFLITEGVYFYLQGRVNLENVAFLPVLCLTMYKFWIAFGIAYLPYFFLGELFDANTKKTAGAIITCYTGVVIALNVKVIGVALNYWGIYTICWFFGGVCGLGMPFAIFLLKETKGKSFIDIQKEFNTKNT